MTHTTKQVRETKAGKSVSAWIVLKGKRQVAAVHAHYSDGGTVLVNVFNYGDKNRSAKDKPFQAGKAGGYGYDKFTAALSGLEIDGHKLTDHCQGHKKPVNGHKVFKRDEKAPRGWHFANYNSEGNGYSDCYRIEGLKYLEAIGYTVISAI